MKPSEISRNVERLVAETLPRYLDKVEESSAAATSLSKDTCLSVSQTRLAEPRPPMCSLCSCPALVPHSSPPLRCRRTALPW